MQNHFWKYIRLVNVNKYRHYVTMTLSLLVALILYYFFLTGHVIQFIPRWTALITYSTLGVIDIPVSINGVILSTQGFSVMIVKECTAVGPTLLLVMGMLGYPAPLSRKFWGVLFSVLGLFLLNQVRIASLFLIGINFPSVLEVSHLIIWQGILVLTAVIIWIVWVDRVDRAR